MFVFSGYLIRAREHRKNVKYTDFRNFSVPQNFPLPPVTRYSLFTDPDPEKKTFVSAANKLPAGTLISDVTAQPRLDVEYDY